jgi:hypothetical protein
LGANQAAGTSSGAYIGVISNTSSLTGTLVFGQRTNSTAYAERMRITSAGVLELAQGQIKFPATQVASADANTLDDYEEGTWTPDLRFGNGTTGITYGTRVGRYTKIGRVVTVYAGFVLTSKGSSTGALEIFGLPFTCLDNGGYSDAVGTVGFVDATNLGSSVTISLVARGTTSFVPRKMSGSGTAINLTEADFNNTSAMIFSATYYVA